MYARLGRADSGRWVLRTQSQRTDSPASTNLGIDYCGMVSALGGMALELVDGSWIHLRDFTRKPK